MTVVLKILMKIIYVVLMGLILSPAFKLQAQTAPADSVVQVTAEAQGLQRVPPGLVPPFGTFWEILPSSTISGIIPLPCPPFDPNLPIYAIADGVYLVDGTVGTEAAASTLQSGRMANRSTAEAALLAQASLVVNLIAQVQNDAANQQTRAMARAMGLNIPSPGGGFGDGGDYSPAYTPMQIDTNLLWLEIITVTNQTASLVIHPPTGVSNEVYDLLYSTNLLLPPAAWQWVLRSYPDQTNLLVPNASDAQGFYRLGPPNDLTANDSLGTNFWLAFNRLYHDAGDNVLSLYISSPVGATGIVTNSGLMVNGPILIVTNCGDTALNGVYVRTNLSTTEQQDWQGIGLSLTAGCYVKGTNRVGFYGGLEWWMLGYDSVVRDFTYCYRKPGINLNGSATNWLSIGDPDTNSPTTICPQLPLINQTFTVAAGAATNINIPLGAMMGDYDVVTTNGIHVTASQPVSVYGLDYANQATTAFTGYPTPLLGTNYCVVARPSWYASSDQYSELAVVATVDNTTVTITPSPTADLAGHATNYTETMQAGQTYQIYGQNDADDVTGTLVTSDKPVGVFAGASGAFVPAATNAFANPLVQEQMPVDAWGTQVLSVGFAVRAYGDSYRVLAAYTNTVVWINGVVAGTNQAGQFLDFILDGPVEFKGSRPIQVAHFANGAAFDADSSSKLYPNEGDPCEILLPPAGHYLLTNTVVSPAVSGSDGTPSDIDEHFLNIIVAQSAIADTLWNGAHVAATNFVAIGASGFYGARIPVNPGTNTVSSSQPVGVEVYGFGNVDAYGYFGGVVK